MTRNYKNFCIEFYKKFGDWPTVPINEPNKYFSYTPPYNLPIDSGATPPPPSKIEPANKPLFDFSKNDVMRDLREHFPYKISS